TTSATPATTAAHAAPVRTNSRISQAANARAPAIAVAMRIGCTTTRGPGPAGRAMLRGANEAAQHVGQKPPVPVVGDVVRCVDAGHDLERTRRTVGARGAHGDPLTRCEIDRETRDVDRLLAGEPERSGALSGQELERHDAHPDQIAAMDALVA